MKPAFFAILLSALFLTACGTTPPVTPTATEVPQVVASVTLNASPIIKHTSTLVPTIEPTLTRQSKRTVSPEEATAVSKYKTEVAPFHGNCGTSTEMMSPDKNWMVCFDGQTIMNRDGRVIQIRPDGDKAKSFVNVYPLHWTADQRYVFFAIKPEIDGCPPSSYGGYYKGLYRTDLDKEKTGNYLEEIEKGFYSISISPTGRRLAYLYYGAENIPLTVKIEDLSTGEIAPIALGHQYADVGGFVWSPDGTKLVFHLNTKRDGGCDKDEIETSSVMLIDFKANTQSFLFRNYPGYLEVQNWVKEDSIQYFTYSDRLARTINLTTGIDSLIGTATPYP